MTLLNLGFFAQITRYLGGAPGAVFTVQNFFNILTGFACWFIRFGIIALGVMLVVYGLIFLSTRGNPTALTQAKNALWWGIVGGLVIMGVFTIVLTIPELLGYLYYTDVDYPIMKILNNCL